ncbi:hypothetical protein QOT17_013303 [Balamuthia mandrillaris]
MSVCSSLRKEALWRFVFVLLWFACFVRWGAVQAQTCQTPSAADLPSYCAEAGVNYPVYLSATGSFAQSAFFTEQATSPLLVAPQSCQAVGLAGLCSLFFPKCAFSPEDDYYNGSLHRTEEPIFQHFCMSACQRFKEACPLFAASVVCDAVTFGDEDRNVTFRDASSGENVTVAMPWYVPSGFAKVPDSPSFRFLFQTSWMGLDDYTGPVPFADCPEPLVFDSALGYCWLNCEPDIWKDEEWRSFRVTYQAFGWISLVASTVLLLSHMLNPLKRNLKDNLVTSSLSLSSLFFVSVVFICPSGCGNKKVPFLAIGLWLKAFTLSWGSSYGFQEMRCNEDEGQDFQSPPCLAFSVFYAWGSYIITAWWLNICINLLLIAVFKQSMSLNKWRLLGYHLWGWGFGVLGLILIGANDLFGSNIANAICMFAGEEYEIGKEDALLLSFYFVPLTLIFSVGIAMLMTVLVYITKTSGIAGLKTQWRLMTVVVMLVIVYVFPLTNNYLKLSEKEDGVDAYTEYGLCRLDPTRRDSCGTFENHVPYELEYANVFLDSSSGLWISLVFGLTVDNFRFWKNLVMRGMLKGELVSIIRTGESSSSSLSGSNKSSGGFTRTRSSTNRLSRRMDENVVMVTVRKMGEKDGESFHEDESEELSEEEIEDDEDD